MSHVWINGWCKVHWDRNKKPVWVYKGSFDAWPLRQGMRRCVSFLSLSWILFYIALQNRFSESVTVRDRTWVCSPILLCLMGGNIYQKMQWNSAHPVHRPLNRPLKSEIPIWFIMLFFYNYFFTSLNSTRNSLLMWLKSKLKILKIQGIFLKK